MSIFSAWFKAAEPAQELKDAIKANVLDVVADGRIAPDAAVKLVADMKILMTEKMSTASNWKLKAISADIATFGDAAGVDRRKFSYVKGLAQNLNTGDQYAVECLAELLREFDSQAQGKAAKTVPATGIQILPTAAIGGGNPGTMTKTPVQQTDVNEQAKLDEITRQAERDYYAGRGQSQRFPSPGSYAAAKRYVFRNTHIAWDPDKIPATA